MIKTRVDTAFPKLVQVGLILGALGLALASGWLVTVRSMALVALLGTVPGLIILVVPVWGVYLSPVADLWFSGLQVLGIPPRNYLVMILLVAMVLHSRRFTGKRPSQIPDVAWSLLRIVILFYGWMVLITLLSGFLLGRDLGIELLLRLWVSRIIMGLALALITQRFLNTRRQIRLFMGMMLGAALVSAIIAILQFYDVSFAWDLRVRIAPFLPRIEELVARGEYKSADRVMGLAAYSISFGYHIVNILPLMIGILVGLFARTGSHGWARTGLTLAVVVMGWATLLNDTRAAIVGVIVGTLVMIVRARPEWRSRPIKAGRLVMLTAGLVALVFLSLRGVVHDINRWTLGYLSTSNQLARIPMFLAGLMASLRYPLGTGFEGYGAVLLESYEALPTLAGSEYISAPHNHLLNQLVAFGVPGLLLSIVYFVKLFSLTRALGSGTQDPFFKVLSISLMGAFTAELVYIQAHNGGPFYGDLMHWYLVGVLLAALRMRAAHSNGDKADLLRTAKPASCQEGTGRC